MSQIPLPEALTVCTRLAPVEQAALPAVAGDPNFTGILATFGVALPGEQLAQLNRAAGDHARMAQIQERAAGAERDLQQTGHNRVLCQQIDELSGLIRTNNAGPADR